MKWKAFFLNFSNGFVYWVLWILKALWIVLSKTINILINLQPKILFPPTPPPPPQEFYSGFIYIVPSSECSLLILSLSLKVIPKRFDIVFWCLKWECCTFKRFMKIHWNPPNVYNGFNSVIYFTQLQEYTYDTYTVLSGGNYFGEYFYGWLLFITTDCWKKNCIST